MILYLRLAWRNIWRHRRRTVIVVVSIAFTMALMMFYDGLIAGFETAIYANAIKVLGGNIQVHASGYNEKASQSPLLPIENDAAVIKAALAQPQVVAASLRLNTGGMATNKEGAFAVNIVGIEPEKELPVNLVGQHVGSGRFLTANDQDVVYIGKGLADAMGLKVGDRFALTGRATHQQMRQRTMTIIGIYDVGMADIEKRALYVSLAEAQNLYGLTGQVNEVMISLKQLGEEPGVIAALKSSLPGLEWDSWQTNYPELQAVIETKGGVMNMFSIIILVIVGIGIMNLLLMAVYERTREIGLLGALGLKSGQITFLFLLEGAMMGLVGVGVGVALGLGLNGLIAIKGLDFTAFTSMSSYMALVNTNIVPSLGTEKLASHVLVVIIISLLASIYPAREAAHKQPAEALHYV